MKYLHLGFLPLLLTGCCCCCQPPGSVRTTPGVIGDTDPHRKQAGELTMYQVENLIVRTVDEDAFGREKENPLNLKTLFLNKDETGEHTFVGEATQWDGTVWKVVVDQNPEKNSLIYRLILPDTGAQKGRTFIGTVDADW